MKEYKPRKVHLRAGFAYKCGMINWQSIISTTDPSQVTCARCLACMIAEGKK